MNGTKSDLLASLHQYNPWWRGAEPSDLPSWRRAAFNEIESWMRNPPAPRALILAGARQVGKTTLLLQTIEALLKSGVPANKILYATFDHPLIRLAGLDSLLEVWRELEPESEGTEYLFFDEIQYAKDWQTWLKLQVDFHKQRRIAVTGSASPLVMEGQESGVGRWHTIQLTTMSFFEYLQIKKIAEPELPSLPSLRRLLNWEPMEFAKLTAVARPLTGHFHEYLLRGGFPQTALIESISQAQRLMREDIVDKVLKRDMTALFGVRRVWDLEQTFLYLCLHDGGLLDMQELCKNLQVKRPTANNYISLLESAHLIHRLAPFGYGKEILRARYKIYIADAAIAPSVLLKGKSLLEDPTALGIAAETAFFNHIFGRYYRQSIGFAYWRGKRDNEVDIVASIEGTLVPFEVKYRSQETGASALKGLREFCAAKKVASGYVITKEMDDFGVMPLELDGSAQAIKIPAPLACYWLGKQELDRWM